LCQSASRVKLIHGLSSASKVEDLWTTRLGTAYCQQIPFSLIVVALCAMHNSSHLFATSVPETSVPWLLGANPVILGSESPCYKFA
jgi:hypothetical protein